MEHTLSIPGEEQDLGSLCSESSQSQRPSLQGWETGTDGSSWFGWKMVTGIGPDHRSSSFSKVFSLKVLSICNTTKMFYAISGTGNGTRNALIHSFNDACIYLVLSVCQRALLQCLGIYGRKEDMPDLYNCGVKIRKEWHSWNQVCVYSAKHHWVAGRISD